MATYTEDRKPYELLVRWGENGQMAAHVGFITRTYKDGVLVASVPEAVMPVGIGGANGFPIADVLAQAQSDALALIDAKNAQIEAMTLEHAQALQASNADADAKLAKARSDADAEIAQVRADYEAQIAALKNPQKPASVSKRQARAALIKSGLLPQVEAALAAIPGIEGELARNDWNEATEIDRNWPLLVSMAAQLGWTDAQVDQLFQQAASL